MASSFELYVALRYLKSKRKEVFISIITVISVLGVAISVMVLDMVLAIMTGFTRELQAKLLNANAHIVVRQYGGKIDNWEDVSAKLLEHPKVKSVSPYTYSQAMITTERGATGILVRGVSETAKAKEKIKEIVDDKFPLDALYQRAPVEVQRPDGEIDTAHLPPLLIGRALQRKIGLPLGVPITLLSPQMASSPRGLIPRAKKFVPIGTYHSGLVEYEEGLAYTSIPEAQRFFKLGKAVSGLEVEIDDLFEAQTLKDPLKKLIASGPESNFYLTDWTEPNKPLWDALKLEKRVYFIVLLLLILIASFSIVSTLVMVVMEKRKDIALLKTMGASRKTVSKVFFLQGTIIGLLGVLFGTVLGYLGCIGLREYGFEIEETVFSLSEVPVHIVPSNFVIVAISAFIITSLAGIYPALKAGKTRPAEILRYE